MAIVNEIKCARCDRKYSGVRSRCPYCGARRIGRGKYSDESDNAKGKMIISVLIIAVFAVAAGILLFSTPGDPTPVIPVESPSMNNPEDDINSLPGLPTPPPTQTPEPTPVIQIPIGSITVYFGNNRWDRESFTLSSSDQTVQFAFTIEPPGFDRGDDFEIEFISNNEDVVTIEEVIVGQAGRYGFKVSRVARGNTRVRIVITNNGEELEVWSRPVHVSS
ncbi:MAG: hypothetical protein FWE83_09865 [Oscillospiraceae bacterium]|nr:hypothetical protein [Oscillospiraceae bacterium]